MQPYEQKIQTGYEQIKGGKRSAFEQERGRFKFSPSYYLLKTLEKYPNDFTKEGRYEIQTEYEDFPDLGILNLDVFVSVLLFLRKYPEPKPEHFKDEIIVKYFSFNETPDKRMIIRMKAQFLKYLRAITSFRQEREARFEEEREKREEAEREIEEEEEEQFMEAREEEYETEEDED
jgi:hypothetical protein